MKLYAVFTLVPLATTIAIEAFAAARGESGAPVAAAGILLAAFALYATVRLGRVISLLPQQWFIALVLFIAFFPGSFIYMLVLGRRLSCRGPGAPCPLCGTELALRARSCRGCGAELRPGAPGPEKDDIF